MDMRVSEGRKWVLNEDGSSEIDPLQGQGPVAILDSVLSTPGYQVGKKGVSSSYQHSITSADILVTSIASGTRFREPLGNGEEQ